MAFILDSTIDYKVNETNNSFIYLFLRKSFVFSIDDKTIHRFFSLGSFFLFCFHSLLLWKSAYDFEINRLSQG